MRLLINLANHLIRYARTRHLTITTRVSRFVYLLHTAPVLRRRRSLLRNVQQPPNDAAPNLAMGGRTFGDQTSGGPMIEHIRIIWALIRFWIL